MNIQEQIKNLVLFVVVNQEGKFFRAKGYNGYGETWVDDINKARLYAKLGPARSAVTYFANSYPKYGIPDIYRIHVGTCEVMQEEKERAMKAVAKIKKKKEERELDAAKRRLVQAEEAVEIAKQRLISERKKNNLS